MPKKKTTPTKNRTPISARKATKLLPAATSEAQPAFARGVLARGEAAKPSQSGKIPKSATHVIVEDADGRQTLKRHKFKAY